MAWILLLINLGLIFTEGVVTTPTPTVGGNETTTSQDNLTTSSPPNTTTLKPMPTVGGNETTTSQDNLTTSSPTTTTTPKPMPTVGGNDITTTSQGNSTTSSPPATTKQTSPHSTTGSTPPTSLASTAPVFKSIFYINFHIENREFNSSLKDSTSNYYKELEKTIEIMYNNVYKCNGCQFGYTGFQIISFSQGSVAVETKLFFEGKDTISQNEVEKALRKANTTATGGLVINQLQVSSSATNTTSDTVPGWGIALLVLVCILVFFLLLALLWLFVYFCRRNHRGTMELPSSRDSYHAMNEYPTYQTHSRFAAPSNKQNPYDEGRPKNGTKPFSYTNPAMANDEL